jgi:histidyl-tRNA synthetase
LPRLSTPRGIRDIDPSEFAIFERIRNAFVDTAELYGFSLMEPATIEFLSTLEAKSGPDIMKEVYAFTDKAGRDLALRFDLTVGLTRYVVSNRALKMPVKLASFADMWRYDEPQMGRYRWFYQWDIEIFGVKDVAAEAEVISFTKHFFNKLGLKVKLHISDRKLVEEYVRKNLGIQDDLLVLELIRALDKSSKKSKEEILVEYVKKGIPAAALESVIELGKRKGPLLDELDRLEKEGLWVTGLKELARLSRSMGIDDFLTLDLSIARGLDYYSGIVFEAILEDRKSIGSLAGGGRYDALLKAFGRGDLSAVGVAGGVERTAMALGTVPSTPLKKGVFVAYAQPSLRDRALALTEHLRTMGVCCETDLLGKGLGAQLEYASSRYGLSLILGERELNRGSVILKDLAAGQQEEIPLNQLEDKLKTLLA